MTTQQHSLSRRSAIALTLGGVGSLLMIPPTHAVGTYDNAGIANIALTKLNQWGGQCKGFANNMVREASGGTQWPAPGYHSGFSNAGGVEVSSANAARGDIIQIGNSDYDSPLHTAIILDNRGGGKFNVVDSNFRYDEIVRTHDNFDPYAFSQGRSVVKIWRMGTVRNIIVTGGSIGYNAVRVGIHLQSGQRLTSEQYLTCPDGTSAFKMQSDGNLVLYGPNMNPHWKTNTAGNPGAYLGMQSDGNVVLYASGGRVLWATGNRGITKMYLQNDGNLVARNSAGTAVWASDTNIRQDLYTHTGSNVLVSGQILNAGKYVKSDDSRYYFIVKPDGNLVLYGPAHNVLWQTNTGGNPGAYLGMQSDGNVVLYASGGRVLWATGNRGITKMYLQNDGNLVARNSAGTAVWASDTNGRI